MSTAPRKILLLTLGTTPQVVTESLYALATRSPPFVPDEVHLITTGEGSRQAQLHLLDRDPQPGQLRRLCHDLGIATPTVTLHLIHSADASRELDDIRSVEHQDLAANCILNVVRQLTAEAPTQLHVSLAGGRKTMGFYLAYALSLFGRAQDELSHVLVNAPFESLPDFFYPPNKPAILQLRDNKTASTQDARIMLAPIPFVRLRELLPKSLDQNQLPYAELVERTQQGLGQTLVLTPKTLCGSYAGKTFQLTSSNFFWLYWLAQRLKHHGDMVDFCSHYRQEILALATQLGQQYDFPIYIKDLKKAFEAQQLERNSFSRIVTRLNHALKTALGPNTSLQVVRSGKRTAYCYGLSLPAAAISFDENPHTL